MRHRPSVADVARLAGVSVGTVSNVLNRPERVAGPTRERVEAAIAQLEFVPSASARQLRAGVAQSVGAVVLDSANPFFTTLARGVEDRIGPEGLALLISSSDGDRERESRALRLFEQHGVRGILVTPASHDHSELHALRQRGTQVILVDARADTDFPSVSADDVHGGRLAVGHLLDQGHTRLAFVNGPHTIHQCADRLEGARQAIRSAGMDPEACLTELTLDTLNADAGEAAAHELLALPAAERPTAVFCVNDLVALGVLRTLLRAGLQVPRDAAVVGYDDAPWTSMLMVPLTTIRQPTYEMGRAGADLLLRSSRGEPSRVRFTPELVVRLSSDPAHTPQPVAPAPDA